jgi:hypothetical protein
MRGLICSHSNNEPATSDNSKSPQDAAIRYEPAAAVNYSSKTKRQIDNNTTKMLQRTSVRINTDWPGNSPLPVYWLSNLLPLGVHDNQAAGSFRIQSNEGILTDSAAA